MAHVPHVFLPAPWGDGAAIPLSDLQRHHLVRVLRRTSGSPVSYTDGAGTIGTGVFDGEVIERRDETLKPSPHRRVIVAVTPTTSQERNRFLVEKLAELGVDELHWLRTAFAQGKAPPEDKAHSWAVAALQQSRGVRLMGFSGPSALADLDRGATTWILAHPSGDANVEVTGNIGIVIGPEGGFTTDELESFQTHLSMGASILRTETAAVVGAVRALQIASRV